VGITPVDDPVPPSDEVQSDHNPGTLSTATSSQLPGSAVSVVAMPRFHVGETSILPMIAAPPAPIPHEPKITPAASDRILLEDLASLPSGPMAMQPRGDATEMRTVVPRPMVQQLIDASIRAIERPVELHLSPEELGRVRISMTFSEASVTLNVHAERAETLELLRRHSEQLAQELRELGYGMISFSFGQRNRGQDAGPDVAPPGSDQDKADPLATVQPMSIQPRLETGLDIRV
jgi:flagellar hook-length control protein FliK